MTIRNLVCLVATTGTLACASNPEPDIAVPVTLGGLVDCVVRMAGRAGYRTATEPAMDFQADAIISALRRGREGDIGLVAFIRWGDVPEQRTIAYSPLPYGTPMFEFRADALRRRIDRVCLGFQ